jgi:hypothetical protein
MSEQNKTCEDPCLQRVSNDVGWIKKWIDGDYKENHKELADKIDLSIDQGKKTNGYVAEIKIEQVVMRTTIRNISVIVVPVFLYIVYRIIDLLLKRVSII